jgi:hypothetical protein
MGAMSQGMPGFQQGYTATQGKRIDHHVLRSGHSQHVTASSGPARAAQGWCVELDLVELWDTIESKSGRARLTASQPGVPCVQRSYNRW